MAGAGYKLFNTGDVLTAAQVNTYLMEQTVMVFANAAARTTALSGVVSEGMISYLKDTNAVEVYDGSNWVSSDDPNAIQNTIVDAKGDLITATAADTPSRIAVGNNGETLVADSSATTGLRWTATPSASNPVLNSAFDIWQRGTSISVSASASAWTADRWALTTFANCASTVSRQSTSDTTNLPNIQYCARFQRNSGQTGTNGFYVTQAFETTNAIPYAGKTVTLSFYARAGANYSPTSNALKVYLLTGTGTDQPRAGANYTGEASPINTTATLTTTWQRFSFTGTIATNVTEFSPTFEVTHTGTAGANDWFELTGVQIDIGNTALPYRRNSATLAGELAACQRYYYRWTPTNGSGRFALGSCSNSTTGGSVMAYFPVTMRTAPSTTIEYSNMAIYDQSTVIACTSLTADNPSQQTCNVSFTVASGGTAYRPIVMLANGTSAAYVGFTAEL